MHEAFIVVRRKAKLLCDELAARFPHVVRTPMCACRVLCHNGHLRAGVGSYRWQRFCIRLWCLFVWVQVRAQTAGQQLAQLPGGLSCCLHKMQAKP